MELRLGTWLDKLGCMMWTKPQIVPIITFDCLYCSPGFCLTLVVAAQLAAITSSVCTTGPANVHNSATIVQLVAYSTRNSKCRQNYSGSCMRSNAGVNFKFAIMIYQKASESKFC